MSRKLFLAGLALLLVFGAVSFGIQVRRAEALVPTIVNVNLYINGSTTWVNITVNHTPPPILDSFHYVNDVQVEINGSVQHLARLPQTTETFFVQYILGPSNNTYSVRALAVCTQHGPSAFSNTVTIPEPVSVILLMMLAAVSVVFGKKNLAKLKR